MILIDNLTREIIDLGFRLLNAALEQVRVPIKKFVFLIAADNILVSNFDIVIILNTIRNQFENIT